MIPSRRLLLNLLLGAAVVVASSGSVPAAASTSSSGQTRMISASGTGSFTAGSPDTTTGVSAFETPGVGGDGGTVARSHSGSGDSLPVGAISQPKPITTSAPDLVSGFDGLNHFQQRFGSGHGNQFSLEPPDQGLCVGTDGSGHTRVLETVNDVMRVYDTSGNALTAPTALSDFLGYAPAIVRSTLTFGPFVTD